MRDSRDGRDARRPDEGWRFAGAATTTLAAPDLGLPEIAFAGRSNVGKSSLINVLTRTPGLARTSSTPGRTQQVNLFELPRRIVFADLPGYGFAKVPLAVRAAWKPLVEGYLGARETLVAIVVLVDSRRGLGDEDRDLLAFARVHDLEPVLVATKIDKLGQGERVRLVRDLTAEVPETIAFSSVTREGATLLWNRLAELAGLR